MPRKLFTPRISIEIIENTEKYQEDTFNKEYNEIYKQVENNPKLSFEEKGAKLNSVLVKTFGVRIHLLNSKRTHRLKDGTEVHTDVARAYLQGLEGVDVKSKGMYADPTRLDAWLPWVHKFISNAKAWILGTHHGVNVEYIKLYLAEYTYRFNRRHDFRKYFSRTLYACMKPPLET
jgi:hypothetical protein